MALGLTNLDYYKYLSHGGNYKVDGTNDAHDFQETLKGIYRTRPLINCTNCYSRVGGYAFKIGIRVCISLVTITETGRRLVKCFSPDLDFSLSI